MSLNICTIGAIENCNIYGNSDTCLACDNKYYWGLNENNNLACIIHNDIEFCDTYSLTTKDTCTRCDNVHVLVNPKNACELIETPIPNCTSHSSQTDCSQCDDGYQLLVTTECSVIPSTENCARKIGIQTVCAECQDGYVLWNGTCWDPLDF